VLKTNLNARNTPCRIFEIADTFAASAKNSKKAYTEKASLALVCDSDLRDLRGAIEGLISSIDRDARINFRPAEFKWAQTGAQIFVNDEPVGIAGVVGEKVSNEFDFKNVVPVAAELDFDKLCSLQKGPVQVIVEAVNQKAPQVLEDIRFVEIYRGKGIPGGKKSVTLSLRFRDEDGTLTHDVVDDFQNEIMSSLAQRVKAQLRTL